jgi:hypothetical protein
VPREVNDRKFLVHVYAPARTLFTLASTRRGSGRSRDAEQTEHAYSCVI